MLARLEEIDTRLQMQVTSVPVIGIYMQKLAKVAFDANYILRLPPLGHFCVD